MPTVDEILCNVPTASRRVFLKAFQLLNILSTLASRAAILFKLTSLLEQIILTGIQFGKGLDCAKEPNSCPTMKCDAEERGDVNC